MKPLENFILYSLVMFSVIWFLYRIENKFRIHNTERPCKVYDRRSLKVFKTLRVLSTLAAAAEVTIVGNQTNFYLNVPFGVVLILFGLIIRILSIRSLGQYWSFHVVRYSDQPLIKCGIYKYISQPAYIGNIYLIGIYLIFDAILTTAMSIVWLFVFCAYRIQVEKEHNLCL